MVDTRVVVTDNAADRVEEIIELTRVGGGVDEGEWKDASQMREALEQQNGFEGLLNAGAAI